jgi:NAD(P)-dependent dehydrogenase (short-subunit alcohol dehydrogenase family)
MSERQRVALVTGAAGGIGRELVLGLLSKGLGVAAVDRTAQGLAELAQTAQERQHGANLMTIEATWWQGRAIELHQVAPSEILDPRRVQGEHPSAPMFPELSRKAGPSGLVNGQGVARPRPLRLLWRIVLRAGESPRF